MNLLLHRRPLPADAAYRRFDLYLRRMLRQAGIRPAPRRRQAPWMGKANDGTASGAIRRAQSYVTLHLGEIRTLDEMAEVAGLSRYHFARRFREEVGEAPWAFVRRHRAEEAVRLLRAGHSPAEAAHEAGFADQAHLTRTLRAYYGRTPGQIRQDVGGPGEAPVEAADEAAGPDSKNVQDPVGEPV